MSPRLLPAILAATFLAANPARAEIVRTAADLQTNKRLAAYIWSKLVGETLFRLGVEQDRRLEIQTDCKSQFEVNPLNVIILSPVDLPDDTQSPTKGAWIFRYAFVRCGESTVYNVLFGVNGGGSVEHHAYYPGSTLAHPVLVRDAMVSAMSNAIILSEVKDCKTADVLDMRVTQAPHTLQEDGKEFKGVWKETWTFKACGKAVEIPITFTPDIGGGGKTFSIKLRR